MLVIGGTGFIGRALTHRLVAAGHVVRVASRGVSNPFATLGDRVELAPIDMRDPSSLRAAMHGINCVYHLARAEESTWDAYLKNDVAVTEAIAEAALKTGIQRFVYTGTIASYDSSRRDRPITEDSAFGPLEQRNLYARSKALCEERLMALHRGSGLPLVIARPGIVLGVGGPLQHWGIGRWHGAGAVRIWGDGRNILPFVLVDDVAEALLLISRTEAVVGQSFNLIGEPLMSARDYFDAILHLTNTRIRVYRGSLTALYLGDIVKYSLKRHLLQRRGLTPLSRVDWLSRGHLSPFLNGRAKEELGWRPEPDRNRFAERAICHTTFLGF